MDNKKGIILVLDSFGIGAAADADKFGDVGADTLRRRIIYTASIQNPLISTISNEGDT